MSDDAREREIAALIIRDVAELPDRTSPADEPHMMLVTMDELSAICVARIEAAWQREAEADAECAVAAETALAASRERVAALEGAAKKLAAHFKVSMAPNGERLLDHVCYDVPGQKQDGCGMVEDEDIIALLAALALTPGRAS